MRQFRFRRHNVTLYTNKSGNGLFEDERSKATGRITGGYRQLLGNAQFSVAGMTEESARRKVWREAQRLWGMV